MLTGPFTTFPCSKKVITRCGPWTLDFLASRTANGINFPVYKVFSLWDCVTAVAFELTGISKVSALPQQPLEALPQAVFQDSWMTVAGQTVNTKP